MHPVELSTVVFGLTQVVKMTGVIPSKFLPVIAVLIGILINISLTGFTIQAALYGLTVGLITTGIVDRASNYGVKKK